MTTFSFLLNQESIEQTLENMKSLKKDRPLAKLSLQISVDLIPDGIGYEATNMQACIVESKEMDLNGEENVPQPEERIIEEERSLPEHQRSNASTSGQVLREEASQSQVV